MKKNIILLSCAFASTIFSILFIFLFSDETFGVAFSISCAIVASILFGIGLYGIMKSAKENQTLKYELETTHSTKLLEAINQSQELSQKNHEALIQSYTETLTKLHNVLTSYQEQQMSIYKETISVVLAAQSQLYDRIDHNSVTQMSSILNQLKALEDKLCTILEKFSDNSRSTNEFQEVLITEVIAINKLLTTNSESTIADEVSNANRLLMRLLEKQAECATKITRSIEDGTEDFSEQLQAWCDKINEELSTTKNLLQSYSEITEQDAAQIRALLEDCDE